MEKEVTFTANNEAHIKDVWKVALRSARQNYWEIVAFDRMRFKNLIEMLSFIFIPILIVNIETKYIGNYLNKL